MESNISPVILSLTGAGLSQRTACIFIARKTEHSGASNIYTIIWTHTASHYLL